MTLYINPDPTITTSPQRSHTLASIRSLHAAVPPRPVQHLFSHSPPPPPHPTPHRNLLTLSIIPTTHKESFCSLSFSVSLYELQVILVQINKTQRCGEALLPEVLWILLR